MWDGAFNVWDLTLPPGRQRQNRVHLWDTQLVSERLACGEAPHIWCQKRERGGGVTVKETPGKKDTIGEN